MGFDDNWKNYDEVVCKMQRVIYFLEAYKKHARIPLIKTQICKSSDDIKVKIPETRNKYFYTALGFLETLDSYKYDEKSGYASFSVFDIENISFLAACLGFRPQFYEENLDSPIYTTLEFLRSNHAVHAMGEGVRLMIKEFGNGPSIYYAGPIVEARQIIKIVRADYLERANKIYRECVKSGKVKVKWKSEYELYVLVKKMYPDSDYQYSPEWLSPQSLDIYIPTLKTAIEYQGKQHYEPVEHFGGEKAFSKNVLRDLIKADKCEENKIRLLYWKYDIPISEDNLIEILKSGETASGFRPKREGL